MLGLTEGLKEGETEGLTEGETEGLTEGDNEGETEGDTDGLREGETDEDIDAEGLTLGETEGEIDGDSEGDMLGETEALGETEGLTDGDILADGLMLGETLGLTDGLTEGEIEGLIEGDVLPAAVYSIANPLLYFKAPNPVVLQAVPLASLVGGEELVNPGTWEAAEQSSVEINLVAEPESILNPLSYFKAPKPVVDQAVPLESLVGGLELVNPGTWEFAEQSKGVSIFAISYYSVNSKNHRESNIGG